MVSVNTSPMSPRSITGSAEGFDSDLIAYPASKVCRVPVCTPCRLGLIHIAKVPRAPRGSGRLAESPAEMATGATTVAEAAVGAAAAAAATGGGDAAASIPVSMANPSVKYIASISHEDSARAQTVTSASEPVFEV